MKTIVLDTDVFSFLLRAGDSRAEIYKPLLRDRRIALSFVTVGELFVWPVKRGWSERKTAELEAALRAAVIIPYDLALCREYGRVKASLPRGVNVPSNDLWIAVSAIRHSLPLLTHNARDFERVPGLTLLKP
jgi:tRNA(fMet)-specific endonuclease VapC